MIRYVPSSAAAPLSAALWRLADPTPSGLTQCLFEWVDDTQGKRWLIVDTTFEITVDAAAELDGIADILQPWIDEGYLPTDTNATLAAFVESRRGGLMVVYEAFPAYFQGLSKTEAEMVAAGLLPAGVNG